MPLKFVRSKKVRLDWDTPRNALSSLRYRVQIGTRTVARNLERSFYRVPTRKLKDGRLAIVVTATDGNGQHATSTKAALRLDRKAPRVRAATRGGMGARVRIVDGTRRRVAGPARSRILWGDGKRSQGTAVSHKYKKPGLYESDRRGARPRRERAQDEAEVAGPMRRFPYVMAALIAFALAAPGIATGEFLPGAYLLSVSPERAEQTDARTVQVDISQDGHYVAFSTQARNLFPADHADPPDQFRQGGIFRRDLVTGSLELVALGDLRSSAGGGLIRRGAQNPSISADGRYIAFSSADQLAPADLNTQIDVYVRDMEQPIGSVDAFELVSARNGSVQPAVYGGPPGAVTGAEITPRGH